jgi:hypothetical protein
MTSERLSESLRAELREILDNDGKAFDLQVARHVYDFEIAAKDLLTVSVKSVKDAMRVVADNQGLINGYVGRDPGSWSPAYREGYEAGLVRRQARVFLPVAADVILTASVPGSNGLAADILRGNISRG